MVVKHYGRPPDLEQIREDCALGKDGVSLLGISKAAEKRGLHSLGGRVTFEMLATEAQMPCIAHWNQNHFVIVYKVKRLRKGNYRVYVADPGKGLLTYTKEEFCEHWVSTKTNGEEKGNRLTFLWSYVKKYRRYFGQIILGLLLGSLIQLVFPFLTQAIVDTGIGGRDIGFIWLVLLAQLMLLFYLFTLLEFLLEKSCFNYNYSLPL